MNVRILLSPVATVLIDWLVMLISAKLYRTELRKLYVDGLHTHSPKNDAPSQWHDSVSCVVSTTEITSFPLTLRQTVYGYL